MGLVHATEQSIKLRIIAIMSVVKARLRRQRITLGAGTDDARFDGNATTQSLVDMIRLRGCEMPGNRFSDIFKQGGHDRKSINTKTRSRQLV